MKTLYNQDYSLLSLLGNQTSFHIYIRVSGSIIKKQKIILDSLKDTMAYNKKFRLIHPCRHFGILMVYAPSLIYNSQKLERTQMPLNRGMDTENVVHLHNGVLLSY
jgi:predicted alpha/beta superfamily hydrolase